jgi:hypothetical protein
MRIEITQTHDFDIPLMISHSRERHAPKGVEITRDMVRRSSVIWVGKADGIEACAVGLVPVSALSDSAMIWLLHTDICEAHPFRFVRWSRKVLGLAQDLYPDLFGYCLTIRSQAWLEWLGAEFSGQSFRIVSRG